MQYAERLFFGAPKNAVREMITELQLSGSLAAFPVMRLPTPVNDRVIPGAEVACFAHRDEVFLIQEVAPADDLTLFVCYGYTADPQALLLGGGTDYRVDTVLLEGHFSVQNGAAVHRLGASQGCITYTGNDRSVWECSAGITQSLLILRSRQQALYPVPGGQLFHCNAAIMALCEQVLHAPLLPVTRPFLVERLKTLRQLLDEAANSRPMATLIFRPEHLERLYEARRLIDQHPAAHYSIPWLAQKVLLNEQQLKTGFRELFGMGPFQYLRQQRLLRGHQQLRHSRRPLGIIARECGYRHNANFVSAFRKMFGITPAALRRKQRPPGIS